MSGDLFDSPWVFRRDEIDLLEDELEDLYEVVRLKEAFSHESITLQEQLETEEQSDQALSLRFGFDVVEALPASGGASREPSAPSDDSFEEWQQELFHIRAHPLYQRAKQWAVSVKSFAKLRYEQGDQAEAFFRIYANVNLVPLKIYTALTEEVHEDEMGRVIALEEYRLALVYLERVVESLPVETFSLETWEWVVTSREQAHEIREAIVHIRQQLSRPDSGIF